MSTNGRPSMAKRQKEMARQEKQREKAVKREQRANAPAGPSDEGMEVVFGPDGTPMVDGDGNIILLPKNPALTDELILLALRRRYGPDVTLAPLPDDAERAAHATAARTAERRSRARS